MSLSALTCSLLASQAQATILTFDMGVGNQGSVLQAYGDRVGNPMFPQNPSFQYGGMDDPTPDITVDYIGTMRLSDDPLFRYGDLNRVLYRAADGTGLMMEIVLASHNPTQPVRLNSFELAARVQFSNASPPVPLVQENLPVKAIRVLDGPGNVLFQKLHPTDSGDGANDPILNPGTVIPGTVPLRRNRYVFNPGIVAPIVRIQIDLSQIASKVERIGIDNINFSQVPSPGAATLMGIAGLLVARRRR
jgi:hypothetical protein